jgi:CP family cyanate transporter-like MFS transporter
MNTTVVSPRHRAAAIGDALGADLIDVEVDSVPPPQVPSLSYGRTVLLGLSIVLIALNLRAVFSSLAAILPEIIATTGMSSGVASALTTLPVFCLGAFAFPAPALARRFGTERTLLAAMLLIGLGTALRGFGNIPLLFVASAMAGAGIAVCNVLLPGLVKRDFGHRLGLMMGLFTMGVCGSVVFSASLTVPILHALDDSWTWTLASWAIPAFVVAAIWAPQALAVKHSPSHAAYRLVGMWRDRRAWDVTLFMGLQLAFAYVLVGWLSPILQDRGFSATDAGLVVSLSMVVQGAMCLITPAIAARCPKQSWLALGISIVTLGAHLAFLYLPLGNTSVWVWAAVLGVGQGAALALAITLIVLRSPDAVVASHLSAMAQGVGYMLAAVGPLFVGLLHGWTGSFSSAGGFLVVLAVIMAISGMGAGRATYVQTKRLPA